jgi:hypothetical protein
MLPMYLTVLQNLNPIRLWRHSELTGNVLVDTMGIGNALLKPTAGGQWTGGVLGEAGPLVNDASEKSALYNGTNNYADAGNIALGSAWTLLAWVKMDASATATIQRIFAQGSGGNNATVQYTTSAGWGWRITVGDDGGGALSTPVVTQSSGWNLIIATWTDNGTSGTWCIYVNGIKSTGTLGTHAGTGAYAMRVGSHVAAAQYFKGQISLSAVFNRAISDSEAAALWAARSDAPGGGPSLMMGNWFSRQG